MKAKRSIAFILFSILLVATFACGPGEELPPGVTVEGITDQAISANAGIDTYRFDMVMTMEEETSKVKMTSQMSGAIDEPSEKMYMDMDMIMEMPGEEDMEISMEMYLVEDWMYMKMEVPGEPPIWMKSPMEVGDWEEWDIGSQQLDWLIDAEVEFLRTETVDGTECYVLKVTPDLEKLWEWALQQIGEEPIPGLDLEELISDFSVEQWVAKDTYLIVKDVTEMTMKFGPEVTGMPFEMTYDIAATTVIYDINQPVTIELPAEAEEAEEVPEL